MDTTRVLRSLDQAQTDIDKLDDYQSPAELKDALQATWQAIDRTLRNLLRADGGAPDDLRLAALSAIELPHDKLIQTLRQRDLISLQLAGMVHEVELTARRAAEGSAKPIDGDHARAVVDRLRLEVGQLGDRDVMAAAHNVVESGAIETPAQDVPSPSDRRGRWKRVLPLAAVSALVAFVVVLLFGGDSDFEKGVAAFQAENWAEAETLFKNAADGSENVAAQLYLARTYRAQRRFQDAANVLKAAAAKHPNDDDVQRELAKLFLDLNSPHQAVERMRRAQELDPDDHGNWIWLVRALRAAGDPNSETILQQAPDAVRAALARTNQIP